jgi:hypothetical protein
LPEEEAAQTSASMPSPENAPQLQPRRARMLPLALQHQCARHGLPSPRPTTRIRIQIRKQDGVSALRPRLRFTSKSRKLARSAPRRYLFAPFTTMPGFRRVSGVYAKNVTKYRRRQMRSDVNERASGSQGRWTHGERVEGARRNMKSGSKLCRRKLRRRRMR